MPRSTLFPYPTLFRSSNDGTLGAKLPEGFVYLAPGGIALDTSWSAPIGTYEQIGRAVQQECRDLPSFPTRRSSDLATTARWALSCPRGSSTWRREASRSTPPGPRRSGRTSRSEERFSRNAEIYPLSLPDALPI